MKLAIFSALFLMAASVCAGTQDHYFGKLQKSLTPDGDSLNIALLKRASLRERRELIGAKSNVRSYVGNVFWQPGQPPIRVMLVMPNHGLPYLFADVNHDGSWSNSAERFHFKSSQDSNIEAETTVKIPIAGFYENYPLLFRLFRKGKGPGVSSGKVLASSSRAFSIGYVDVEGQKTLVQYEYDLPKGRPGLLAGALGVDSNGDGKIDTEPTSPELALANNETVVFRVGTIYVSTESIDINSAKITMKRNSREEYKRIELRTSEEVPDFSYTDFRSKKHSLSELRGKYVLLYFWFSQCAPCRADLPYLKSAYKKYRSEGFEILGINTDESLETAKAFVAENNIGWAQAAPASDLITHQFRISSYPTKILLDPNARIVTLGITQKNQLPLDENHLLSTLNRLIRRDRWRKNQEAQE
jgi:thiol-disulfide isomerase/thioredoxin